MPNPGPLPGFVVFTKSKQLQLLGRIWPVCNFGSIKNLDHPELFVGNRQNTNVPLLWKDCANPTHMHFGVFSTCAMTHIDGKLKHSKTILLEILPEARCRLPFLLSFSRQIEKDHHPQNAVFIKTHVFCTMAIKELILSSRLGNFL